ncbi:hypothetical protein SteCoe_5661 [Stentor coeruleus]|uniref:Protein kinase domain-containing protein n=1 Tax=Stentor coeruleus TaxID=5963 RepID=A0A1R2CS01_9CILI|nr:hypothetical protein SteCoe_5661 [Stentor coeruleus]
MGCAVAKNHHISSKKISSIKTSSIQLRSAVAEKTHTSHLSDYVSVSFLGAGAYGEVLSARHIPSASCRALKIVRKNKFSYNDIKSGEALRETFILEKLNHQNIIKYYEMLEDNLSFYIITELCQGGSLNERLRKLHKFPETMTAEFMKQVLDAVEYLHSKNIVHRDIKLENILLTDSSTNNIKIADFGCSTHLKPNQTLNNCCGSLYYLAPEVLNENYNEKADIWSCGILAVIMLTGCYPYAGNTSDELKEKIKTITSSEIIEKISQMSCEVQDLIKQMLETDPNKRITAEKARKHAWFNKAS